MSEYRNYPGSPIYPCPGRMPDPYRRPDPYRMPWGSNPQEPCWMPREPYRMPELPYQMPQPPSPNLSDPYTYPGNLPEALELIKDAVSSEREDELFYDYLLNNAPSQEDKEIITTIRDDERKHFRLFRQIYQDLTGQMLPPPPEPEFTPPPSYCAGVRKALFGELGAVEKYRRILFALQDRVQINKLTEIITDELKHANKWNYLYVQNECFEEGKKQKI